MCFEAVGLFQKPKDQAKLGFPEEWPGVHSITEIWMFSRTRFLPE